MNRAWDDAQDRATKARAEEELDEAVEAGAELEPCSFCDDGCYECRGTALRAVMPLYEPDFGDLLGGES